MKEKTSITLSPEVLTGIDRLAGSKQSRSEFIERVLRRYIEGRKRAEIQARDLELLNRSSEALNAEAEEVLDFQAAEDSFPRS